MSMGLQYNKGGYRGTPYHYAMTHNYDLVIDSVPAVLSGVAKGMLTASGAINCSCTQVSNLPNSNLNEGILSGNIRGVPFHQAAGRESSVREMNFTLYDYQDYGLLKFFECWKSLAVNRFDHTQNLLAMVPNGIKVVMYDTDRSKTKLVYDLFDTVCTKCSIGENLGSEPEFVKLNVSLKCGYYNISRSGLGAISLDAPTSDVL
jgi:hypothetical protein